MSVAWLARATVMFSGRVDAAGTVGRVAAGELDANAVSSSLENMLELVLLGELVQEAWFGRGQLVDVLRSQVDAAGHDIVVECAGVVRHVQLKSRRADATTAVYAINTRLAEHQSGCVVWVGWSLREGARRVSLEYRWFGGRPGEPLPDLGDRMARHVKADSRGVKAARPHTRVLNLGRFERLAGPAELLDRLFGPA